MFDVHFTVGQKPNGTLKMIYLGDQRDAAFDAGANAGDAYREVHVYSLPPVIKVHYPIQEQQMADARVKDAEQARLGAVARRKNEAIKLAESAAKQAEEAKKLLADAEAAEKAIQSAVTSGKK